MDICEPTPAAPVSDDGLVVMSIAAGQASRDMDITESAPGVPAIVTPSPIFPSTSAVQALAATATVQAHAEAQIATTSTSGQQPVDMQMIGSMPDQQPPAVPPTVPPPEGDGLVVSSTLLSAETAGGVVAISSTGNYICKQNECGLTFASQADLTAHILAAHKPHYEHSCELCGQRFHRRGDLARHIKTVHEQVRAFTCESCQKEFKRKGDLNRHIKSVHEKRADFTCDICNKGFTRASDLKVHKKTIHEQRQEFQCKICGKNFKRQNSLATHQKTPCVPALPPATTAGGSAPIAASPPAPAPEVEPLAAGESAASDAKIMLDATSEVNTAKAVPVVPAPTTVPTASEQHMQQPEPAIAPPLKPESKPVVQSAPLESESRSLLAVSQTQEGVNSDHLVNGELGPIRREPQRKTKTMSQSIG